MCLKVANARTFHKYSSEVGREILAKGALEKRGLSDECDSVLPLNSEDVG